MDMGKLSVIIPVYQAKNTLEACVLSVVQQNYDPLEIILVDDGSTDGTQIIADRLKKKYPFIRLICQEHGGVSEARNRGIREAQGDWILFLDADDLLVSGALESLENGLSEKVDACCGIVLRGTEKKNEKTDKDLFLPGGSQLINEVLAAPTDLLTVHGWVFRRNVCEKNLFRAELRLGEDSEWILRVLYVCRAATLISAPVYRYNLSADSAVHQWKPDTTEEYLKTVNTISESYVASEKNWPLFVLTTLLLILTHDTFHPANPGTGRDQRREAIRLRNMPVFREALQKADLSRLDTGKKVTLACFKKGYYSLVYIAVKFRQWQNTRRM